MRISFRLIGRMAFVAGLVALCTNAASAPQEKIDIGSLKAVKTVNPVYPEAVKEEGIAGEVVIWAGIDRQGNVRHPSVFRPLHPALDQAALEAVSQWKFEPVFHAGEPIAFLTYISVVFDPGDPGPEKGLPAESPLPVGVRSVLGVAAEYGLRLNSAARFYTCRERIEGSVKTVGEGSAASIGTMLGEGYTASTVYVYPVLGSSSRYSIVNDYQLINDQGRLKERRISIFASRPARTDENRPGIDGFVPPLPPVAVPARLLSAGYRHEFIYSPAPEEEMRRRKCHVLVIEAARKRACDVRSARVWVDEENHRIPRIEVEWAAGSSDDRILAECRRYHLTPHMTAVIDYEIEKNGLLYPSRSEIRVEVTGLVRPPQDTKAKIDIRYDRYRFFSVQTEPKIIR